MSQRLAVQAVFTIVAVLASSSSVSAQMKQVIFENRPTDGFFSENIAEPADGITMLRQWDTTPPKEEAQEQILPQSPEAIQDPIVPENRDDVRARFGDPLEDVPVKAVNDAPKPFQAMMACLNIGDDRCAYDYAKQYARYMDKLGRLQDMAVAAQSAAYYKEGLRDIERLDSDEVVKPFQHFVVEDLKKEKESLVGESPRQRLVDLLPEALKLDILSNNSSSEESIDLLYNEESQKRQVKSILAPRLIPFRGSKVDVYLFIRPMDRDSSLMAKELKSLATFNSQHGQVNFIASTLQHEEPGKIQYFKAKVGADIPLIVGSSLADLFKVTEAPTVVLSAPDGSETPILISGFRKSYFIEAVVEILLGRSR
ncbi:MAG: hypothetical protein KDD64_14515 [Bdellovibrionales bacterium]|nr:hypothetical protein [Bdellovibrionales bacterium]